MLDGNKYGHRWSEFSWNDKKGGTGKSCSICFQWD